MTNPVVQGKKVFLLPVLLAGVLISLFSESPPGGVGEQVRLGLKLFPGESSLRVDGHPADPLDPVNPIDPVKQGEPIKTYLVPPGYRELVLQAPSYHPKTVRIDLEEDYLLEEKLERRDSHLQLLGETPTGGMPKSITFSSDGRFMVVALLAEKGLDLVSTLDLSRRQRIELTPPGKKARGYVEAVPLRSRGEIWVSQMDTGEVHIVSEENWEHVASIDVGGRWPKVIAFSADESLAFVSNWLSRDLSVIDVEERRLLSLIPLKGIPRGMAATADGRFLYVCLFDTGEVDKIDLGTFSVLKTLPFGPGAKRHIVLDCRRNRGYLSDMATGRISCFSLETDEILTSLWVGSNLNTLTISGDGRYLFASSRGRNNPRDYTIKGPEFGKVSVVDTATMKIRDWTWARNQPTGLAISPDGSRMAFSDFLDDNLELYDISGLFAEGPGEEPGKTAGLAAGAEPVP